MRFAIPASAEWGLRQCKIVAPMLCKGHVSHRRISKLSWIIYGHPVSIEACRRNEPAPFQMVQVLKRRQCLCRDQLMDFLGDTYPPAIQAAFRTRRLGRLSDAEMAQELRFQPGMLPNALVQSGPTLTAAAWQAQVSAPSP